MPQETYQQECVEENDEIAMEWFEKAAENGNEKALKITGRRKR